MPLDNLLDILLSDARGKCFACNLLDSVEANIFPIDKLERLIACVLDEYQADSASVTTSASAIGLFNRVASGFYRAGAEKHVMAGIVGTKPSGKVSHGLRSQTLAFWLEHITDPHLMIDPKPLPTPRGVMAYNKTIEAINEQIANDAATVFSAGKTLGYEVPADSYVGLAWITQEAALPSLSSGDDLRDILGLETQPGDFQVLLTCDAQKLDTQPTARPTFADGGNSRFRVKAEAHMAPAEWGTTVNLKKLLNAELSVDGIPERVMEKIPLRDLQPKFTPIGWVEHNRGVSANDSNNAFYERHLSRGRTDDEIRQFIKDIKK